tara:strand:- start:7 stop:690 length:684 start_codon:yes stop_codon:yes gene_type:complete
MQTKDVNGWTVPEYEGLLSGSCFPLMQSKYRDWYRLKISVFDLQTRRIFLDVGANFGLVTVPAMKYFKRVIAIEPHPLTAYCLRKNIRKTKGSASVIEAAAGEEEGTSQLYDPPNQHTSGYSSLTHSVDWTAQSVKMKSIDSLELPHCDYMKVDVQGAELDVIRGAEQTIKSYKPVVYVETKDSTKPTKLLKEWGYVYHHIFGIKKLAMAALRRQGHSICIHRSKLM